MVLFMIIYILYYLKYVSYNTHSLYIRRYFIVMKGYILLLWIKAKTNPILIFIPNLGGDKSLLLWQKHHSMS